MSSYCVLATPFNLSLQHLPKDSNRAYQALFTANSMVNTINVGDRSTYEAASQIAKKFLGQPNGSTQHVMHAIGNCHIGG